MSEPNAVPHLNDALEGRYRIERELGEGGMATVYLADDLRHERKVALKVLKPELAAVVGAERFLAEIKTTARLQHPHILPLHDSGEADSFLFYVMPYVGGESLRERLERERQLPVDDAVQITKNVAEALDYAHSQGVIHRDVKPANILLQAGKPVVSDFGIALAVGAAGGGRLTETGLSLGTPHYMSPEQATGDLGVGPATDIYALGCVLYEMLVGEPPHTGGTAQAVLVKIVTSRPARPSEQRAHVPPHVDAAVLKAIEKVAADRFASGARFAEALEDTAFRHGGAGVATSADKGSGWTCRLWPATTVAAVLVATWALLGPRDAPPPPMALSFELPVGQLIAGGHRPLEISRDGSTIVYVGVTGGSTQLYLREVGDFEAHPISGTDGATEPFLSPDGGLVAYFVDGAVHTVGVAGDAIPVEVAQAASSTGGAIALDGTIVFSTGSGSLWRVAPGGGPAEEVPLRNADPSGPAVRQSGDPSFLPGESHMMLSVELADPDDPAIGWRTAVVDVRTGRVDALSEPLGLTSMSTRPRYVRSGHVVSYAGSAELLAAPFDERRRAIMGQDVPVLDDLRRPPGSVATYAVSEGGVVAYAVGGYRKELVVVDRSGRPEVLDVEPRGYRFPSVSPDGSWLSVTVDPQPSQLWMIDLRTLRDQPLTTEGYHITGRWSPDGGRLSWSVPGLQTGGVYISTWPDPADFVRVAPWVRRGGLGPQDWVSDTQIIGHAGTGDLGLLDLATGEITRLTTTPARETLPRVSPDSRWLAYVSDVSGSAEIWVAEFPTMARPRPVSEGTDPIWSRSGSELFFRNGDAIWSLRVRTSPDFSVAGNPEYLLAGGYDFTNAHDWDLLTDSTFIMIRNTIQSVGREVRITTAWLEGVGGR